MLLRFVFFCQLVFFLCLPTGAYAFLDSQDSENKKNEKGFDEKIDSIISKRLDLPTVRAKLENTHAKFVPVYGHVLEAGYENALDMEDDEDLFAAESLFNLLNERMLRRNDSLLKMATPDVRSTYKRLMNRFNFITLERIKIHVDYYYDRAAKMWVRPAAGKSAVTITMIVKSGYFLYQEGESLIEIRRYGYYIPSSNVKRIFFADGYSEVLADNPNEAPLGLKKVLPYKLVEKISQDKKTDYSKKIRNLLKKRDFAAIPLIFKEVNEYCENNSCRDVLDYRPYLNTLKVLCQMGVLGRCYK